MKCRKIFLTAILATAIPTLILNAQTVTISNGVVGSGHLDVSVDAYGSYGNFNAAYVDNFEPSTAGSSQPTFSAGVRLFSGSDKVLLTDMMEWLDVLGLDQGTWTRSITSPVMTMGQDTAISSFEVLNGGSAVLSFNVTQVVSEFETGVVALLDQSYEITNETSATLDFSFNRVLDADLIWGTPFDDDHVSASECFIAQHEPGFTTQSMALTAGPGSVPFTSYWGAKNTHEPTDGPPAFGFGTDVVVWGNGGLPDSWKNYLSYVGYNMAGDSGLVTGQDGHIGLDWELSLEAGQTTTVVVRTVYGAESIPKDKDCVLGDVNQDGAVSLLDVAPFVDLVTTGMFQCEADTNEDGVVSLLDVAPFVAILTGG